MDISDHATTPLSSASDPRQQPLPLPSYVRLPSLPLLPEDANYLQGMGAVTLPEDEFRDELLASYVRWIHPQLPFLDLQAFVAAMTGEDPENQISLLLFQAVMFAGSVCLEERHFRALGFSSRTEGQAKLFQRVKVCLTGAAVLNPVFELTNRGKGPL